MSMTPLEITNFNTFVGGARGSGGFGRTALSTLGQSVLFGLGYGAAVNIGYNLAHYYTEGPGQKYFAPKPSYYYTGDWGYHPRDTRFDIVGPHM